MSCNVIFYYQGAKMLRPVRTEAEYRALRSDRQHLQHLEMARKGREGNKARLMQFNYSIGVDGDLPIPLKGADTVGNSVGMDIDHIDKNELPKIIERVLEKKADLGLLMLERSCRMEGLHVVFTRRPEMTNEENLKWAADLLGVEYDKGAKDLTRVFYATSNEPEDLLFLSPELFKNTAATTLTAPLRPTATTAPTAPLRPADTSPAGEGVITPKNNGGSAQDTSHLSPAGEMPEAEGGCGVALATEGGCGCADGRVCADGRLAYLGLPYHEIIAMWWKMYNDGREPVKSNRDVLTFELAVNLRHICGFDRALLMTVIPCYDEFPESQKLKCIDSALAERRTQMPKRLKDVLAAVRQEHLAQGDEGDGVVSQIEELERADELYHYDRLPKLPQGVADSVEAAGRHLAMPTLIAIAPAIGALATGVKLDVHGRMKGLNLCSFVVGEFASGKGQLDDIIAAWMHELQAETDMYTMQEDEWAAKTKRMKSGKAPEQPKLPVRMLTLNNTVANIADRLANTQGKHSFSFTPEADNVALKWRQSVSDFSVMLRQAYDEARYDREAKSADAVRVHIPKLLWNVTMCGTQDALYRVITNYTDGLLSRISIARTPDNTYAPLSDSTNQLTDEQAQRIREVAHLLPLMQGEVVLPKLEERGRQWLEKIRLQAMKNDDRVMARQRMRGCVNAQRITCALWLPMVAQKLIRRHGLAGAELQLKCRQALWSELLTGMQTEEMMQIFDIVADYLLENDIYFFRERIERAYDSDNYKISSNSLRINKGLNDSIFERLADSFTVEQAYQQYFAVKGASASKNGAKMMLRNWRSQGLIVQSTRGTYTKNTSLYA